MFISHSSFSNFHASLYAKCERGSISKFSYSLTSSSLTTVLLASYYQILYALFLLDYEESKLMSYYFLPFSRGPRMCIGYRFAMTGLKILLAKIIRDFAFAFKDEEPHRNNIPEFGSISTLTLKPFPVISLRVKLACMEII